MKIGILGGSFDPPHVGHHFVIQQILELRPDIDKIYLVPAYKHQWKPAFADINHRLNMLENLTKANVEISDVEIKRKGISYSIDTIKEIKKQTDAKIYWIVGSDIVYEFDKWSRKDELIKEATFLVFPRDPYHLPKKLPSGFECVQDDHLITTNISSTSIRQRIKSQKPIDFLVPENIKKYIIEYKLYKK